MDVHEFAKEAESFGDIVVVDRHKGKLRKGREMCMRAAETPWGQGFWRRGEKQKSRIASGLCYVLLY
jgi:hypothetical protein